MSVILPILAAAAVLLGFTTAVLSLITQRHAAAASAMAAETAARVQQISVQVDGRLTMLLEREAQLLGVLHESGTPVPPRPPELPPAAAAAADEKLM
jgi:hypothetical protein